jgi:hypothetical protein
MRPGCCCDLTGHRLSHLQREALVCDDTRRADILVTAPLRRVIVEADGPWHFVRTPDGSIVHQDGTTALRDRLFQASGYVVLSVRVEDKAPSDFQTPSFRRWLQRQLQETGLACSTVRAQVWPARWACTVLCWSQPAWLIYVQWAWLRSIAKSKDADRSSDSRAGPVASHDPMLCPSKCLQPVEITAVATTQGAAMCPFLCEQAAVVCKDCACVQRFAIVSF